MTDRRVTAVAAPLLALGLLAVCAAADEPKKPAEEPRAAAGTCLSEAGVLLEREAPGKPWKVVAPRDAVSSRDLLVALPGSRAVLQSKNGAAQLTLAGNLPALSGEGADESAVVLHASAGFDLDFTLDRGRAVVANKRDKGPAKVRVRVHGDNWDLTLKEPGAAAAFELFGRWPQGVPFRKEPRSDEKPGAVLQVWAVEGSVVLDTPSHEHLMSAPPGAAYFRWDSQQGELSGPQRQARVPPWAQPDAGQLPSAQAAQALLAPLQRALKDKPVPAALHDLLAGADSLQDPKAAAPTRELAVFAFGATDDLGQLLDALGDEKHPGVRLLAVEALRHWIGRAAGQDRRLYDFLLKDRKFAEGQAAILVQLLHSFSDEDLNQPSTYELLLAYLNSARLPIRELAIWHLNRHVPAGRSIKYNAAGSKEEREAALKEWKKLIPEGELPKRVRPD